MTRFPRFLAALAAAFLLSTPSVRAGGPAPVVVELFTSQGCSACPPADAFLGELAGREDVIALSLHVDYWDYLGWRDSFSIPAAVSRQVAYRDRFDKRMVYTPQMVVQGRAEAVGSARREVERLIAAARDGGRGAAIPIAPGAGGGLVARLAPGRMEGGALWLARYRREARVKVARGENAGRRLAYHNVVVSLSPLGRWDGKTRRELPLPMPGQGEGVALWVQAPGIGPIRAAGRYEPEPDAME